MRGRLPLIAGLASLAVQSTFVGLRQTWQGGHSRRQTAALRRAEVPGPERVLTFWFGDAWGTERMSSAAGFDEQTPLWWGRKADNSGPLTSEEKAAVDANCQEFASLVRLAGQGKLSGDWETPTGLFAQMLLCDQLSRNCFRGTAEAFAYDGQGVVLARRLFQEGYYRHYGPQQLKFLVVPGMHSEELRDHEMNVDILRHCEETFGDVEWVRGSRDFCMQHKVIIDRFGRYPYRNGALGRANTPEEDEWLSDYDALPGFAKSQMPAPQK